MVSEVTAGPNVDISCQLSESVALTGVPLADESESVAQTGGLRWVQRFVCDRTSTDPSCGFWLGSHAMLTRRGLRGYRRPLLLRVENTPGPTMEDHVDRPTPMDNGF